jgi:hypothetical protein
LQNGWWDGKYVIPRTSSTAEKGDDDEPEMDCPTPGDGELESRFELACSQEKTGDFKK